MTFGDNLRRARKLAHWTQTELAEAAGYTRSSIANMERGKQDPTLKGLHGLADVLGTSVAELVDDDKDARVEGLLLVHVERTLIHAQMQLETAADRLRRQANSMELTAAEVGEALARVKATIRDGTNVVLSRYGDELPAERRLGLETEDAGRR